MRMQNVFVQAEQSVLVHGKMSPAADLRLEQAAPVATPHLPITATTKLAEIKGPGTPSSPAGSPPSPVSEESPVSQSGTKQRHQSTEEPVPAGDWSQQHHRLVPPPGQGAYTCLFSQSSASVFHLGCYACQISGISTPSR